MLENRLMYTKKDLKDFGTINYFIGLAGGTLVGLITALLLELIKPLFWTEIVLWFSTLYTS